MTIEIVMSASCEADITVDKVVFNCFGLQGGVALLEGGGAAHVAGLAKHNAVINTSAIS